MNIIIPPNEKRIFKAGILPNGLKYVAIEDTTDDSSHISMAIKAGSLEDPTMPNDNYMGLAHFLEHMLFLGSEKFKDKGESYFEEVIKNSGGSSNAYTGLYETVYFFNILTTNIEKPLEIFSRFFIDPLFNESSVEREINAVNSEHLKNITNDLWSTRQAIYNLSKKDSGINRFTTGTLKTLQSHDFKKLRDRMIQFYNDFYCANNMCLTIQSNDIDKTIRLIETYFSSIQSGKIGIKTQILCNKFEMKNKEYLLVPTSDEDTIIYFWNVPTFHTFIGNCAPTILDIIVNYNSINNLRYFLKREGLATNIHLQYSEEGIVTLSVTVTKNTISLADKIKKINSIIQYYFTIIHNLDHLYRYIEKELEINYLYDIKINNSELVNRVSVNLHYYDIENVFRGSNIVLYRNLPVLLELCKLLKFNNVNIIYSTKTILDESYQFKEDIYYFKKFGELKVSYLPKESISYNINLDNFKENLDIKADIIKINQIIPREIKFQSWYGGVDHFNEPFVFGFIYLQNNRLVDNIKDSMLTLIASSILNQYIGEMFCFQLNIGYTIKISMNSMNGLVTLSIGGLNTKYKEFFNKVLTDIKTIKPEKIIIDNTIDKIREMLINISNMSPWEYVEYIVGLEKYKYNYNNMDMLQMLDKILAHNYINLITKRMKRLVEMTCLSRVTILYGNIKEFDLIDTSEPIEPLPIPRQINDITIKHPNKNEKNILVMYTIPCGPFTPKNAAMYIILATLLEQPTYDELRTKGQLGYLVKSLLSYDNSIYSINIKVQSGLDIKIVENKMSVYIEWFKTYLYETDSFNTIKESVKGNLLSQPSNMNDLMNQYIGEIENQTYIFNKRELIASEINDISKKDIIILYNKIILNKKIIKIMH
jgi:secreted Zn-dependent insulinase-like peptidase